MSKELLPCPFCGAHPTIEPWHGGKPTKRMVSCDNDDCAVCPSVSGETEREAITRWNLRSAASDEPVAWNDRGDVIVREDWAKRLQHIGSTVSMGRAIPDSWEPILFVRPPRPVSELSEERRREIAEQAVDRMDRARLPLSRADDVEWAIRAALSESAQEEASSLRSPAEPEEKPMHGADRVYETNERLVAHHQVMQSIFPHNRESLCEHCGLSIDEGEIYRCYDCAKPFHRLCCRQHNSRISSGTVCEPVGVVTGWEGFNKDPSVRWSDSMRKPLAFGTKLYAVPLSLHAETVNEERIDDLAESARLLGITQAKKGFDCYTENDGHFERAMHQSIAKHRTALREVLRAAAIRQLAPSDPGMVPSLVCEKCGADRYKEDCRLGHPMDCPIAGKAA